MPQTDAADKRSALHGILKLVAGMLTGITGLSETDPLSERRRMVEDYESAAGWVDAANPGFVKYRAYFDHFKRHLSGSHRATKWNAEVSFRRSPYFGR